MVLIVCGNRTMILIEWRDRMRVWFAFFGSLLDNSDVCPSSPVVLSEFMWAGGIEAEKRSDKIPPNEPEIIRNSV